MVGPVLDFLTQHPGVDPARIALLGVSLGGYLAPRAAAYERRLAAVIALDGVFDAVSALTAHLPLPHDGVVRRAAAEHDGDLDQIIADARAQNPTLRWACDHGRYVTGTSTDRAFLASTPATPSTTEASRRSPAPSWYAKQPLTCSTPPPKSPIRASCTTTSPHQKKILTFTEGRKVATLTATPGALRLAVARIFDWLDDTI